MEVFMEQDRIDEALELLWKLDEEGDCALQRFKQNANDQNVEKLITTLQGKGFVVVADDKINLTENGGVLAKNVVRRHRLAERLFTDVFDLPNTTADEDACRFEHILSEELTDSVCTFLGHPPLCPHGKPIPRGECCKKYSTDMKPLVGRLVDFEVGQSGKIVFITPSEASRIGRLSSIGIIPGTIIRLIQRRPSIVLQVDETTIAIDPDLAREIFVKKV
jgi:DtxR family Mn-dependent transcriptional regulator